MKRKRRSKWGVVTYEELKRAREGVPGDVEWGDMGHEIFGGDRKRWEEEEWREAGMKGRVT